MAVRYVSSNPAGSNTSPYNSLATAATTWSTAITGSSAGDVFAFSNLHSESDAAATTFTMVGTTASPNQSYSFDNTQTTFSATNLLSGAKCSTTANNAININGSGYLNGITFVAGASTGSAPITLFSSGVGWQKYEACSFQLGSTGSGTIFIINTSGVGAAVEWYNTTASFSAVGQTIKLNGPGLTFKWQNTASALTGAAVPTTLFPSSCIGSAFLEGVDLSTAGSGKTLVGSMGSGNSVWLIKDCKIASAVTIAATPSVPGPRIYFTRCDSAGSVNRFDVYDYAATETRETSITRVGTIGDFTGSAWSKKIVTTGNALVILPYDAEVSMPINKLIGSTRNVTVYGTINSASLPNNNDIWLEVVYPTDSGDTLGGFVNSGPANPQSTGSSVTSDSSTWNGGGSGAGWSPFSLTVTLTAQLSGPLTVRIKAAKPSTTFYIDPVPVLS